MVVKGEGVKEEDIIVIAIKVLGEDHLIIREQEEVIMATRDLGGSYGAQGAGGGYGAQGAAGGYQS